MTKAIKQKPAIKPASMFLVEDAEPLMDASVGGMLKKLDVAFRKSPRPSTFDQLVGAFHKIEPVEQMRRWTGMSEHPVAIRYRMVSGGKWTEACAAWLAARADAIAKEFSDPDASAWKAVTKAFRPKRPGIAIPVPAVITQIYEGIGRLDTKLDKDTLARLPALGIDSIDPTSDAVWVYEHLDDETAARRAPTRGAASMLAQARENRKDFWGSIWPKAMGELIKRQGGDHTRGPSIQEKRDVEELRTMLRDAVAASKAVR